MEAVLEETGQRAKTVRFGPITITEELRKDIEWMAEQENRSLSNMAVVLLERGIKFTEKWEGD